MNDHDEFLKNLSKQTRRSYPQTVRLFEVVQQDRDKMVEVEEKLKNNFLFYCPFDEDAVNEVLAKEYGSYYFKVDKSKL